jgi:predicted metal-dependent HD superfamily phosphohydrolase
VAGWADDWREAARAAGATASDADLDAAAGELIRRWSEPHRQYHDVTHLAAVLEVVNRLAALAPHPERVRLAAWTHDAVYDARATGDANEQASAALADSLLTALGVPAGTVAEVARLVRLTAGHATAAGDPDGDLLCDADLAILASDEPRYGEYAAAIRREYAHVPEDAFRAGRAQVLRGLLELPTLYRLAPVREAWEAKARANLEAELRSLG